MAISPGGRRIQEGLEKTITHCLSSYDAVISNRTRKRIVPSGRSADSDIITDLPQLRAHSRDLYRNDKFARGIVDHSINNEIGRGITGQSVVDRDFLMGSYSDDAIRLVEKSFERHFRLRSESKSIDVARRLDIIGLERQRCWCKIVNGESITVRRRLPGREGIPLVKVQEVESDRLANPPGKKEHEGREIRGGVEIDGDTGEAVAYWICRSNPNDYSARKLDKTFDRIPALDERGEVQVIHEFVQDRPDQNRGVPLLAPIINVLRDINAALETELLAMFISSCVALYLETTNPAGLQGGWGGPGGTSTPTDQDTGKKLLRLQPGAVFTGNEKPQLFNPQRPGHTFAPFVEFMIDSMASGTNLASFNISKRYKGVNYSSIRGAVLPERRAAGYHQQMTIIGFLKPLWNDIAEECVLLGKSPLSPAEFYREREAWQESKWQVDKHSLIDPLKEVNATIQAIEAGLTTLQEETGDAEGNIIQRGKEENLKREVGAVPESAAPDVTINEAPEGEDEEGPGTEEE